MVEDKLHAQLEDLHAELERAAKVEPGEKDMVGHLLTEVVDLMSGEEVAEEQHRDLLERLESKALEFDFDHPRLAAMLRRLVNLLAGLGV